MAVSNAQTDLIMDRNVLTLANSVTKLRALLYESVLISAGPERPQAAL